MAERVPELVHRYLRWWGLSPDGDAFRTHSSWLLPVSLGDVPAILKLAVADEERWGAALMVWWAGDGAAAVLRHDAHALLLERAHGTRSLVEMAHHGDDDGALRILCDVAARLHAPRRDPPPTLVPLPEWFGRLEPTAARLGGVLLRSAAIAHELLDTPRDVCVLHGDIHHENVLDFGRRGWLAIDPKGLIGERGFDFANLFCNPDLEVATAPGRLPRGVEVVAEAAGLERRRLLQWIVAYAGLSASWTLDDGEDPRLQLEVAEIAAAILDAT